MGAFSDLEDITWVWVGKGSIDPDNDRIMYQRARVTRISDGTHRTFTVGDVVYVCGGDGPDWLGHVIQFFQWASHAVADEVEVVEDSNAVESMRCTVRWMYSTNDIDPESYPANPHVERALPKELYFSDHVEKPGTNALECIEGRAWLCATPAELRAAERNPPKGFWKGDPIRLVRYFYGRTGHPQPIRELAKGELAHLVRHPSMNTSLYNNGQRSMFGMGAAMKGTGRKFGGTHRLVRSDTEVTSPPPRSTPVADSPEHDWGRSPGTRGTRKSTRPRRVVQDSSSDEEDGGIVLPPQAQTGGTVGAANGGGASGAGASGGGATRNGGPPPTVANNKPTAKVSNGAAGSSRARQQAVTGPKSTDTGGQTASRLKRAGRKRQATGPDRMDVGVGEEDDMEFDVPVNEVPVPWRGKGGGASMNGRDGRKTGSKLGGKEGARPSPKPGPKPGSSVTPKQAPTLAPLPSPRRSRPMSSNTNPTASPQGGRKNPSDPGPHVGQGRFVEVVASGSVRGGASGSGGGHGGGRGTGRGSRLGGGRGGGSASTSAPKTVRSVCATTGREFVGTVGEEFIEASGNAAADNAERDAARREQREQTAAVRSWHADAAGSGTGNAGGEETVVARGQGRMETVEAEGTAPRNAGRTMIVEAEGPPRRTVTDTPDPQSAPVRTETAVPQAAPTRTETVEAEITAVPGADATSLVPDSSAVTSEQPDEVLPNGTSPREMAREVHLEDSSGLVARLAAMPEEEANDMMALMPSFYGHVLEVMSEEGATFEMGREQMWTVARRATERMRGGSHVKF